MANFKYGASGLALTKRSESLRLDAYQDSVGVWTIGYGHTGTDVRQGLTITEEQASILLAADVAWAVTCVNKCVTAAINQNQFDALVDFTFNLGCTSLAQSTLLRMLNAADLAGAAAQFLRWNKAGGKVLRGLTIRRQAEMDLFNTPVTQPGGAVSLQAAASPIRVQPAGGAIRLPARKAAKKKAVRTKKAKKSANRKAAKR
jgi:lysozyme